METEHLTYQMKRKTDRKQWLLIRLFLLLFRSVIGKLSSRQLPAYPLQNRRTGFSAIVAETIRSWVSVLSFGMLSFLLKSFPGASAPRALLLCDSQRTSPVEAQAILILFQIPRTPVLWKDSSAGCRPPS